MDVIDIVSRIIVVCNIDVVDIVIVVIIVVIIIVVVAVGVVDEVGSHRGSRQYKVDESEARDGASWSTIGFSIIAFYKHRKLHVLGKIKSSKYNYLELETLLLELCLFQECPFSLIHSWIPVQQSVFFFFFSFSCDGLVDLRLIDLSLTTL